MPNHPVLSAPACPFGGKAHGRAASSPATIRASLALVTHQEVIQRNSAPESDHRGICPHYRTFGLPIGADFWDNPPLHTREVMMMGFDTGALLPLDKALQDAGTTHLLLRDGRLPPAPGAGSDPGRGDKLPPLRPPFDNAAMDGYAVRLADLAAGVPLPVAGKALRASPMRGVARRPLHPHHDRGPCAPGADAVVMQEETQAGDNGITFLTAPTPGQNIRRRGGSGAGRPGARKRPAPEPQGAAAARLPWHRERHGAPSPQGRHLQHRGRAQASGHPAPARGHLRLQPLRGQGDAEPHGL